MAIDRTNILRRARVRSDQVTGQVPTDADAKLLIDEAGREVWYDLWGAGFPVDFTSTSITANGSATYLLNAGAPIMGVVAVYLIVGTEFILMRRLDRSLDGALRSLSGNSNGLPGFYEVRLNPATGPVIEFLPKPTGGSYRVDHLPEWPGFANDADIWRGPARSDELLVLKSGAKFCFAEGEVRDGTQLLGEYERLSEKVQRSASWLDARNTARIRDVETNTERDPFDYFAVGPGRY